jgi:hypothetical protein
MRLLSRQSSANFDTGWAGFDVLLIVALAEHAWIALGRSLCLSTARNCRDRTARRRCVVRHHRNTTGRAAPIDLVCGGARQPDEALALLGRGT